MNFYVLSQKESRLSCRDLTCCRFRDRTGIQWYYANIYQNLDDDDDETLLNWWLEG
jgi:hypothetical protein